ncbi:MAG: hypothetical protein K0M54_08930 [Pseudomonas sp.]|uniref:hypothetical protein n=1 Tax=Pseudomonas sp. TaxID=306 RepID=UPI0025FF41BC|nr:hypothetical protein [Pseudomonas sp.]MBW8353946.1 hypothetical protein [Pseudomonas sp.]
MRLFYNSLAGPKSPYRLKPASAGSFIFQPALLLLNCGNQPISGLLNLTMPLLAVNEPEAQHFVSGANQITVALIETHLGADLLNKQILPIRQSHILHELYLIEC